MGLVTRFNLPTPHPPTYSIVGAGRRQSTSEHDYTVERYYAQHHHGSNFVAELKFALRHEPLDLAILEPAFEACDPSELEDWVRNEPTGGFSRRAWFLYETLCQRRLRLPDAASAMKTVPALDPGKHLTIQGQPSKRHRVVDNLLGTRRFCPTIRRTRKLEELLTTSLDDEAQELVSTCDPEILARAINYLYTKETKSSYAIEGESVSASRAERFVNALRAVKDFELTDRNAYVDLQNLIVDHRYAARDWRNFQNFIGETVGGFQENVHCIFPRPEDVADLMAGLGELSRRVLDDDIDAVVAAAAISFGFVFIHPFEDGNGRIHRFLIHHVLARKGLTPPGILFPVSAAMVRDQAAYDRALESFSWRIMPFVEWHWDRSGNGEIVVTNATDTLYRYFDATVLAEYLYERVIETVRRDLREEIAFIAVFDRAIRAVMERVDMPDRRAALFVKLCMQNDGVLSAAKRSLFAELTNDEVRDLEREVADARQMARTT